LSRSYFCTFRMRADSLFLFSGRRFPTRRAYQGKRIPPSESTFLCSLNRKPMSPPPFFPLAPSLAQGAEREESFLLKSKFPDCTGFPESFIPSFYNNKFCCATFPPFRRVFHSPAVWKGSLHPFFPLKGGTVLSHQFREKSLPSSFRDPILPFE